MQKLGNVFRVKIEGQIKGQIQGQIQGQIEGKGCGLNQGSI